MNVEDFRKTSSYKETVIGIQLTDIEKKLNKKRGELHGLYKKIDQLLEKRRELEAKKNDCLEAILSLVQAQKDLTE